MDNNHNWNWNNGDVRRVSSVYSDDDETNAFILINPSQNTEAQTIQPPAVEAQQSIQPPPVESPQSVQPSPVEQPPVEPQNIQYPQNTEFQVTESPNTQPQSIEHKAAKTQRTEQSAMDSQNIEAQSEFHPIVLPPDTRQYENDKNSTRQTADRSTAFSEKDISDNKVSAIAAYLLGPVGIIIALLIARDSAYTAFHVRQALKITICSVLLELFAAVFALFGMIPLVGIIFRIMLIMTCAVWFGVLVIRLIAITQVSSGEAKEPVIIGNFDFLK